MSLLKALLERDLGEKPKKEASGRRKSFLFKKTFI
jgi:hypothetical protein